jgi:glycine hydroxymethyltransferase
MNKRQAFGPVRCWDLRAHHSLPLGAEQHRESHEIGSGFNVLRLVDNELDSGLEDICAKAANRCFAPGRASELFVNPHPVSGSIANLAVVTALVNPGDRVVSFARKSVGHFSLGGEASLVSRIYTMSSLEPGRNDISLDFRQLWREQARPSFGQPRLIACGPSAYPRRIDWASLRALADSFSPRALIVADVSHIAGPIAAGLMESPCAHADVVTLTTYKSLCGPPGAIILSPNKNLHERIASALIPGLQDRAYLTSLGQLATSLNRAATPEFRRLQEQAARLAVVLAASFVEVGLDLAFGGTDSHMIVVDLRPLGLNAADVSATLAAQEILADAVVLPSDAANNPQGLRFGTVVLAQTGCDVEQVRSLGIRIASVVRANSQGSTVKPSSYSREQQRESGHSGASELSRDSKGRPDEFMFRQFCRHSHVLRTPARHDYFMLSGGANLFPVSAVWKELLALEISSDFAYGWYTSQQGVPTLQRAVSMWENYAASRGKFPEQKPLGRHVCMTLGASQAVAAVFDYWAAVGGSQRATFVGLNYGLFERLAHHHGFAIHELLAADEEGHTLPPAEQIAYTLRADGPALVVLVTPNNPSGEQYDRNGISQVLRAAVATGSLVLFDQVGQIPMAQDDWSNVGELIVQEEAQENAVVVNSFSKSDGVPGFRLGYLLGPKQVIQHAARYQLVSTMNPPTVPILPPYFVLLSRCVYMAERLDWTTPAQRGSILTFARHMLEVTTAIAPPSVLEDMNRRLSAEGFEFDHQRYVSHQEQVGCVIKLNHAYVLDRLKKYVSRVTPMQGGFNFLVELEPFAGKDEDDVCRRLFDETAVAILTESCFRVSPRRLSNFWVRISLAAPADRFADAVDRLAGFLARF